MGPQSLTFLKLKIVINNKKKNYEPHINVLCFCRHPLQELCCSPFVPNKTQMGSEYHKMVIITGPNASGKSVYLKQVNLESYVS